MVSALLKAPVHFSVFHGSRIALGPVRPDKTVPQAVKSIGLAFRREELEAVFFIVQLILDDALFKTASRCIEAHLEVAVIHIDLMETEFRIWEDRQVSRPTAVVAQAQIPDLHRFIHRDKQSLFGTDSAVVTQILHIAQTMPAGEVFLRLAHRLPGDRPVVPVLVVPEIDIMTRSIHGDTVRAKARDPVVFRAATDQVAACGMVKNAHHVPGPDVIGPGHGNIDPVDHVFSFLIVEVSVLHVFFLPSHADPIIRRDGQKRKPSNLPLLVYFCGPVRSRSIRFFEKHGHAGGTAVYMFSRSTPVLFRFRRFPGRTAAGCCTVRQGNCDLHAPSPAPG